MDENLKGFLYDLVILLHEKYNDTLKEQDNEDENDKNFRLGQNIAYYDVLDIIDSHLVAFGYDGKEIGKIVPELSKKAKL